MSGAYEIGVETITCRVSVGKHEWLLSLAWSPQVCEQGGVPVDLVEEMRLVFPTSWAVAFGRPLHVGFVRINPLRGIVAGWEVYISTERGSVTVAVLIREADTGASVPWILDSNSVQTVRAGRV